MKSRSLTDPALPAVRSLPIRRVLTVVLLLNALLVLPEWWMPYTEFPAPLVAPEALLLPGLLLALPPVMARPLAVGVTALLMLGVALALSDLATGWALGRPVNVYIDWPLLASVEHLLRGAVGKPLAWLVLASAVAILALSAHRLFRVLGRLHGHGAGPWGTALGVGLLVLGVAGWQGRDLPGLDASLDTPLIIRLTDQTHRFLATAREQRSFAEQLRGRQTAAPDLSRLDGRDVILAFIESYGVTLTRHSRYAATAEAALAHMQNALDKAGLSVVTAYFDSPVQGGQSWLAHGTVLSGLWLDNQIRYDLFLAARGASLVSDFNAAGYRTAAIMPAITDPWPAGRQWGYDAIHDHARIDYAGPALNWVTMPDQYTWHYFQQRVREPLAQPLFAELALISSHAPWTPIIDRVDWDTIGRGEVFARWADAGPPPGVVWSERERVRRHYARAVDYALRTASEWAARDLGDGVLILLGDHQPAPLITGEGAPRAVPVHVISRDEALARDLLAHGFRQGLRGGAEPLGTLAALRPLLHQVFDEEQARQ